MGEYIDAVINDDFELAEMKVALETAVEGYDRKKEVVVAIRLRCGMLAVVTMPLVPHEGACRKLAEDYEFSTKPSLQLNID